jgi:N-acetylmuramoyl-L-alanine amidase
MVEPAPLGDDLGLGVGDESEAVARLQAELIEYGYGAELTGTFGRGLEQVVQAFQRHFRPARINGRADASTRDTLRRLLAAKRGAKVA